MVKAFQIIFIVALATIFSCNHLEKHLKSDDDKEESSGITAADKLVFSKSDPPLGGDYGREYSITVTETELLLKVHNQRDDELMSKRYPFSKKEFDKLLQSLKKLKQKKDEISNSEIPDGGTTTQLSIYRDNDKIFDGVDYGGSAKNFTGGDIDISYLIDDLEGVIESTKKE